jgi:hypothetical protein
LPPADEGARKITAGRTIGWHAIEPLTRLLRCRPGRGQHLLDKREACTNPFAGDADTSTAPVRRLANARRQVHVSAERLV